MRASGSPSVIPCRTWNKKLSRVGLTRGELERLGKRRALHGNLWRSVGGDIPFNVHATPSGNWRIHSLPRNLPYEEKTSYEMYVPMTEIEKLKTGKMLYVDDTFRGVVIRSAFISRDDVF